MLGEFELLLCIHYQTSYTKSQRAVLAFLAQGKEHLEDFAEDVGTRLLRCPSHQTNLHNM